MALKMTIVAATGVTHQDSYIKINSYSCDEQNTIYARVRAYASRQHALDGLSHLEGSEDILSFIADYADNAVNTKKQIYDFVKTLPKYSSAIDVLE